jgi:hypothetical protein
MRKLIRAVLHALGLPVTPQQQYETAVRIHRPMLTARYENYRAGQAYLVDLDLPATVPVPRMRDYPLEAITSTLERVVPQIRIEGEPITAANRTDTRVIEQARPGIEGPLLRQVLDPARETIASLGEDEEEPHYGWARILVGAESCSFCAMLASRGAVYTSRAAATGRGGSPLGFYHTPYQNAAGKTVGGFCDCSVALVRKDAYGREMPWEGQVAAARLEELWKDSIEGYTGKGARNAFRREWESQVKAKETKVYLPPSLEKRAA